MIFLDQGNSRRLSLATLLATVSMTGIHHVYRLGPELIIPTIMGLVLPVVLLFLLDRTGHRAFGIAYAILVALVVFWFGFVDGFLDHVLKAAGLENVTLLPGSDVPVVATYFNFGSPELSDFIYEVTGILSALLAVFTTIATAPFLAKLLTPNAPSQQ